MRIFLFTTFFISQIVFGQVKYLASPNNEVIPIKPNERVANFISSKSEVKSQSNCNGDFIFGYSPYVYQPTSNFGGNHKDVFGQWFIAPADGTIDTLFWSMNEVGNADSTVSIRIFKSNIFRGQGPGFSPYPPPCLNWGYYIDTNDLDNGITPFRDKATDTNWISTAPIDTPTFDPLGEEIWGNGGFQFRVNPFSVNALPLDTLGHGIDFKKGDAFFLTMSVTSPNYHISDVLEPTRMRAWGSDGPISTTDENYPSRLWKFFEHDSGASNCAGTPVTEVKKGWVARGPFTDDTLYSSAYNWWYSMRVRTNIIPVIPDYSWKGGVTDSEPLQINFLKLCSLDDSNKIGSYWVYYQVDHQPFDSLKATINSDTILQVIIPPFPSGTIVQWYYKYFGPDSTIGISNTYRFVVVGLRQNAYCLDTTALYDWIEADSTFVRLTKFFQRPPNTTPYYDPLDDGTSGPIDIGFPFTFFGEELQYAWIGVDGAISLTASPTDTQHINYNSLFQNWYIPVPQIGSTALPKNFIAPYYGDYTLLNWIPFPFSTVKYLTEPDRFTIEWNIQESVYYPFNPLQFRLILDKSDSSISFVYRAVDSSGTNRPILVGFQKDSLSWFHVCRYGLPIQYKPRRQTVFNFSPSTIVGVKDKSVELPSSFALEQNYPNPFNPVTEIRYQISSKSHVKLVIYDVLGREAATLVDEMQDAGFKSVSWDASKVPSGIYFYKMSAGKFTDTKKMILLK
ncbi:MAG: T9SS type A sorting domain-containing protein [Ignavibacteriales bacterium]|nr:T9SS type A sorting domain-containing protein [Ignavibacteriales bacterium]